MTRSSVSAAVDAGAPAVLAPTDIRSAHEALRDCSRPFHVRGSDTAGRWAGTPLPTDLVVHTGELTGLLTHNPADMTVAVRAGTRLRDVQSEVAPHGQRIAFDAARVARGASLGGLVASADSGPLALAHGSLRDLVIGATVVLADGTVARSGGHVIKNVAGYDLAKLMHGSYGTLGLIAEVVLRLHPIPEATATVRMECGLDAAGQQASTLLHSALEPAAVEWFGYGLDGGTLLARFEGTRDGVAARTTALTELATVPTSRLSEQDAEAEWSRHANLVAPASAGGERTDNPQHAVLRIGTRPSKLPGVLAHVVAAGGEGITAGLGTGIATVTLAPRPEAVRAAHEVVSAAGGTSVLRERPEGTEWPAWGQRPSASGVLTALKQELDPRARLCPGRLDFDQLT